MGIHGSIFDEDDHGHASTVRRGRDSTGFSSAHLQHGRRPGRAVESPRATTMRLDDNMAANKCPLAQPQGRACVPVRCRLRSTNSLVQGVQHVRGHDDDRLPRLLRLQSILKRLRAFLRPSLLRVSGLPAVFSYASREERERRCCCCYR